MDQEPSGGLVFTNEGVMNTQNGECSLVIYLAADRHQTGLN